MCLVKSNYRSYLLRIWQASSEPPTWVASLEDPHTHKVIHFNSLEALLPFLRKMIQQNISDPDSNDETTGSLRA